LQFIKMTNIMIIPDFNHLIGFQIDVYLYRCLKSIFSKTLIRDYEEIASHRR